MKKGIIYFYDEKDLFQFNGFMFEDLNKRDLEVKQYKFMTNFSNDRKYIYEKALATTGVDACIKNEATYGGGIVFKDHSALWVNTTIGDMSKFWRVFDSIKDFYKEEN